MPLLIGNEVRVVTIDCAPWFMGVDVRRNLGFSGKAGGSYSYPTQADKTYRERIALGLNPGKLVMLINEAGLYTMVMRFDKQEARKFQDWVTSTVLPAMRKDGAYISGEMNEDEFLLKSFTILKDKAERPTGIASEKRRWLYLNEVESLHRIIATIIHKAARFSYLLFFLSLL